MKSRKNLRITVVVLASLFLFALFYSLQSRPPSAKLPNGSVIYVTDAKVGFTNEFKQGYSVEKLLGNVISSNGWNFGLFKLQRPIIENFSSSTNAEALTIQFKITSQTTNAFARAFPYRSHEQNYRIVHWGDDGFRYTEQFPESSFLKGRGDFGYLYTSTYARMSRDLHLEIQNRENEVAEWTTVAHLTFPNPKPTKPQPWTPLPFPVTNSFENLTAVLGTIQVQQPRDHVRQYPNIWQHAVDIPFKFFVNGQAVTNWAAEQMATYDASGNYNRFGAIKSYTNGWNVYRAWRSATPTVPWRLVGHFTPESDFAKSNLFTLEIPVQLAAQLVTNLGGLKTTIAFRNSDMLQMRIPEETTGKRLLLVDAFNERGDSVKEWSGSWGQHGFLKQIDTSKVKSNLTVTVAIVTNLEFEFLVQPLLVQQLTPPTL